MTALLELRNIDAGYGPFRALFDVSVAVPDGGVVALVGSNGAGKTTVARVCSGLVTPTAGQIVFGGANLTGRPTYEFARAGIVHAPEGRSIFASLTVEENLVLAFSSTLGRKGVGDALGRAYELFPRLGERRQQLGGLLSGGEQRMLALARVLVDPPRLLVADELSLGLAPIVVEDVYRTLGAIRGSGTSILLVEQYVRHALALADDVVVLTKGEVTLAGPVSELGDVAERLLPS